MRDDFCVFIMTHGRPDRVHTYDSLMKAGYTGKVYIVIDNEDKTEAGYRQRYGDKVLQFDKAKYAAITDEGDNFQHRKAIVYARNACWELAEKVGCKYFLQFDDDYVNFRLRYNKQMQYCCIPITHTIDEILMALLDFYIASNATSIAMSQGADHIGGDPGDGNKRRLSRKCMNSWFCDIGKPIKYFGHMNEDVSAYVVLGHRGHLFLNVFQAQLNQKPTQTTAGGMSDLYLSSGTYVKSFYTIMAAPSCVRISTLQNWSADNPTPRIHHDILWNKAVPKILDESCRKAR